MTSNPVHTHKPPTLADLAHWRPPVRNANEEFADRMSRLERIAIFVTERVGTMGFFIIILVWTTIWLGWNFLAPKVYQFDPPMAFVFWLFISNLIQLHLMPLIMVAQNLQSRHAEIRAQTEYELTIASEHEIEVILHHLEYQNAILISLVKKLGLTEEELEHEFREHLSATSTLGEAPLPPATDTAKPA